MTFGGDLEPVFGETTCSICGEDLLCAGDCELAQLRCGHIYHEECVLKWIKYAERRTCPVCRDEERAEHFSLRGI